MSWIIRSHAPVRADGVTPFSAELEFDSLQYWPDPQTRTQGFFRDSSRGGFRLLRYDQAA